MIKEKNSMNMISSIGLEKITKNLVAFRSMIKQVILFLLFVEVFVYIIVL